MLAHDLLLNFLERLAEIAAERADGNLGTSNIFRALVAERGVAHAADEFRIHARVVVAGRCPGENRRRNGRRRRSLVEVNELRFCMRLSREIV